MLFSTKKDSQICSAGECYPSLQAAISVWDAKTYSEWIATDDPLLGCQDDAFDPIHVKGRAKGRPELGNMKSFVTARGKSTKSNEPGTLFVFLSMLWYTFTRSYTQKAGNFDRNCLPFLLPESP